MHNYIVCFEIEELCEYSWKLYQMRIWSTLWMAGRYRQENKVPRCKRKSSLHDCIPFVNFVWASSRNQSKHWMKWTRMFPIHAATSNIIQTWPRHWTSPWPPAILCPYTFTSIQSGIRFVHVYLTQAARPCLLTYYLSPNRTHLSREEIEFLRLFHLSFSFVIWLRNFSYCLQVDYRRPMMARWRRYL